MSNHIISARCFAGFFLAVTFILGVSNCQAQENVRVDLIQEDSEKQRLLIYMIGGDLEEEGGALTADLLEIARNGSDITVYARVGGVSQWQMPGWMGGHAYDLKLEQGQWQVLRDLGDLSLGDLKVFSGFLHDFGSEGADLILWGHGCEGLRGIGYDIPHGADTLTLQEMEEGLSEVGIRFRLIGLDACRMATLECAWLASPYSEIFAASAYVENLSGWRYARIIPDCGDNVERLYTALRSHGVSSDKGTSYLTVLNTETLLHCSDALRILMDRASTCVETVNMLASQNETTEARQVRNMLDGQTLLFIQYADYENPLNLNTLDDAYTSYVLRVPAR